jgi:hypothetical protein
MSYQIVNKTPITPSVVDSEAYVDFANLGPRPVCGSCGGDEDCPECANDLPYLQPVVSGDVLYFQFRSPDNFNLDPKDPSAGWKNGTDPFWIEAKILFSSGASLLLNQQNIILGKEVGWFRGSYQNINLDSQRIEDYLDSIADPSHCFSLEITTYRNQLPTYTTVRLIVDELPSITPSFLNGVLYALEGVIYRSQGGSWVETDLEGEKVFSSSQGGFFEWNGTAYITYDIQADATKVVETVCTTGQMRFTTCEQTVKVEGLHGETDCRGNYFGGEVRFRDRYRIWASLEQVGYRTDKTTNEDNKVTEFKNYELWLLRLMKGIPIKWAERLNNTLLGSTVFIDSNEYINFSDIERNNDTGLSWWSSITCERLNCNKTNDCEEVIFTNPIVICEEPTCPEVGEPVSLVGELGDYTASVPCGDTFVVPAATIEDTEGNVLGQVDAGQTLVLDCSGGDPSGPCEGVTVRNSDSTFLEEPASGETLVLEDYTVNINLDGSTVATEVFPAMVDLTINIEWV